LGFQPAGTIRQVGFKFGRWLDLDFYQLTLDTPAQPVDG
jgi:phosphinothricin acetyltransferase